MTTFSIFMSGKLNKAKHFIATSRSNWLSLVAIFISISLCLLSSCSSEGTIAHSDNYEAKIYPDYKEVTIPCNIAAMNFSVQDSSATNYGLLIESGRKSVWVNANDKDFSIDKDDWQELIKESIAKDNKTKDPAGKISFTIAREINGEWIGGKKFSMNVSTDSIDDYITYRLVPPGYEGWYKMGIYQHQLSTSEESAVYVNSHNNSACMNCHTPYTQHSDCTLFHMRSFDAGTYLMRNGAIERLDAKTDSTSGAFVYPSWHPNGKLIAFSTNQTAQTFHTANKDRIEVFDASSDIVMYDIDNHEVFSTPILKDSLYWETYPTFSPDGKWLYYCTAPRVDDVEFNYADVKYSLCRIAFDAEKQTFGSQVDTIYSSYKGIECIVQGNAKADSTSATGIISNPLKGKSLSFPRISPDGRFLICTIHNYGNFSIWHKDADLYIIDLNTLEASPLGSKFNIREMKEVNSSETESYHTWSSTSRWLVFSSRRDDGLYTRPYFTHIDEQGNISKPFMLPQDNPRKHYKELDFSYNIPEFMTSKVPTPMREIYAATKQDSIRVHYRTK